MKRKIFLYTLLLFSLFIWAQDIVVLDKPILDLKENLTVSAKTRIQMKPGFRIKPPQGIRARFMIGEGGTLPPVDPPVDPPLPPIGDLEIRPIEIHVNQHGLLQDWTDVKDTLINASMYEAVKIGEHLWMNKNLNNKIPFLWAEPWRYGTDWTGWGSTNAYDLTQAFLDRDLERLMVDKTQFQVNMDDFHEFYGRYYTRTDIEYFKKRGTPYQTYNERNLVVYEGDTRVKTDWKVPMNYDFRQLFAMIDMKGSDVLGQIAARRALSYRANENPLAYDIYDPNGGMNYRTSWFENNSNELGFNMMPNGSRLNGDGPIYNGLGPNNGAWDGKWGDIYHLFHTAKYLTADSQVGIHDNISTGQGPSWHWYGVRFCRELTKEELGYKLYINKQDYQENYQYTILELNPASVDIIKLGLNDTPPSGYYELPKGYLRGFYVKNILNSKNPKTMQQIVNYLKKVDDDLFYAPGHTATTDNVRTVAKVQTETSVVIYPNPVGAVLNIDANADEIVKSVEIFNMGTGSKVFGSTSLGSKNSLDVSQLAQGIHIVVVETDRRGKVTTKIMKK